MSIRDASLFVEVIGHGYPLLLMHGGPGADHWSMLPFRRLRRPVHAGLLRPSLQRTVAGRPRLIDDVGEPDGRRRRAAREAGFRAVGRARPLVRWHGRPRVRPAVPRQPVAPAAARHMRRQSLAAAERAGDPRQARLSPGDGEAGPALLQRADRALGDGPGPDVQVRHRLLPPSLLTSGGARTLPRATGEGRGGRRSSSPPASCTRAGRSWIGSARSRCRRW